MDPKTRAIELDAATADLLEARAAEQGVSVAELVAELASHAEQPWPGDLEEMCTEGRGPWSPETLAEDEHAFAEFERTGEGIPLEEMIAWLRSLDTDEPLPRPMPRKL